MDLTNSPVLFPTDFQSHSESAFEYAVGLAVAKRSKLIAVHVSNMPDMPWSTPNHPTQHESLREELQKLGSPRVDVERIFAVADPGPEICRLAKEHHCDMIVMGISNKCGLDQLALGSVHDYVLQNAECVVATLCQQPVLAASEN